MIPLKAYVVSLEEKRVESKYIKLIKDMCDGVVTNMRTNRDITIEFSITIGLHQGSKLGPYIFALTRTKIEYPKCKSNQSRHRDESIVRFDGQSIVRFDGQETSKSGSFQ